MMHGRFLIDSGIAIVINKVLRGAGRIDRGTTIIHMSRYRHVPGGTRNRDATSSVGACNYAVTMRKACHTSGLINASERNRAHYTTTATGPVPLDADAPVTAVIDTPPQVTVIPVGNPIVLPKVKQTPIALFAPEPTVIGVPLNDVAVVLAPVSIWPWASKTTAMGHTKSVG